jgi:protein Mpv17
MLDGRPVLTKSVTSGIVAGAGDVLCQALLPSGGEEEPSGRAASARAGHGSSQAAAAAAAAEGGREGGGGRSLHQPPSNEGTHSSPSSSSSSSSSSSFWERWDAGRTARFAALGTALVGPAVHSWYSLLAHRVPGGSACPSAVARRVVLDQLAFAPAFNAAWLSCLRLLEALAPDRSGGRPSGAAAAEAIRDLPRAVRDEVPGIVAANWALWVPAQAVNFAFVPLRFQVLYSNVVALAWNAHLSRRTSRAGRLPSPSPSPTAPVAADRRDESDAAALTKKGAPGGGGGAG